MFVAELDKFVWDIALVALGYVGFTRFNFLSCSPLLGIKLFAMKRPIIKQYCFTFKVVPSFIKKLYWINDKLSKVPNLPINPLVVTLPVPDSADCQIGRAHV